MLRRIIEIDEEKCNGCGLCAKACHEGAIGMVNGKAKLMHEHYCDGLGDCLPACPTGAIRFVEREAPAYDEAAVQAAKAAKGQAHTGGCPGSRMRTMQEKPEAPAPDSPGPVMYHLRKLLHIGIQVIALLREALQLQKSAVALLRVLRRQHGQQQLQVHSPQNS